MNTEWYDHRDGIPELYDQVVERLALPDRVILKSTPRHTVNDYPRIGLDVDGVLANFASAFCRKAKEMGIDYCEHYSLWQSWSGDDADAFGRVWAEIEQSKEFWLEEVQPIEAAHVNFPVAAYVTAFPMAAEIRAEWLSRHGFPDASVHTVPPNTSKKELLKSLDLDVYVDDKPSNVREALEVGIDAYLLSSPANYTEEAEGLPRLQYLTFLDRKVDLPEMVTA